MTECRQRAWSCVCVLDLFHSGTHHCECGSEWQGRANTDTFKPITIPDIPNQQGEPNGVRD